MPTASSSVEVRGNPEQVWSLISDGPRMAEWLTPVRALEEQPPSPLVSGARFKTVQGNVAGAQIRITESTPSRRLAWNAGPPMAHMMGIPENFSVDLEPSGEGTKVTFTIKSSMMVAPLIKMMSGLDAQEEAPKTAQAIKQAIEGSSATG